MLYLRAHTRRWIEPPRQLLLALAAVTVASASAFGWLGWEMLRRDDAVETQREQERLEHQADLTVQAIERLLVTTEERLASWVSRPSVAVPAANDGLVVVFTPEGVQTRGTVPLLFRPFIVQGPESPVTPFTEGETAEFQKRDLPKAATIFERLAQSSDPALRAAALMRLGRVLRASAQHRDALATYTRMAALGSVRVAGLPAELLARAARLHVFSAMGDHGTARVEARALLDDLAQARWAVTRGQYEFYRDDAAAVAGVETTASRIDIAVAQAAGDLWNEWRSALSPTGRRSVRVGDAPLLVTWRADDDRVAAWMVPPDQLLRRAARDSAFATAFTDHDGTRVAGALGGDGREAIRMPADTRLPWVIHVKRAEGYVAESRLTRGGLTVLGILVMSVFLVIGVYFVGRAVRREMELARLHADFVSAVSHEFRTPLAAMRQLSEVLAAGRVPDQERRAQYYEALASESRRLQHLVENLLDFGRLQAGGAVYRFEPLEPRALVVRVVDEFRGQAPHASCRVDIADAAECGRVLADPDAIGLALYNLLDNAIKYGGTSALVDVSWERQGGCIAFRVRDHGPGVAPEERARIFERFVRGRAAAAARLRGTGIGLALVKQIATSHGGGVAVEAAPGSGSVFTIWLPAAADPNP